MISADSPVSVSGFLFAIESGPDRNHLSIQHAVIKLQSRPPEGA